MIFVRALAAMTPAFLLVACGQAQPTAPDAGCLPATELCNGVDDDCDGEVDEGFALAVSCTAGVGACAVSGTRGCTADGSGTICSAQPKAPTEETCNGVDDDCDGAVDEGVSDCCAAGDSRGCGVDRGECQSGTQRCSEGRTWDACLDDQGAPVRLPGEVAEDCNSMDDDCDGSTDEELPSEPCDGPDADFCLEGILACFDAQGLICSDTSDDTVESCNALDDDCDGQTDEPFADLGSACGTGLCSGGTLVCAEDGAATVCSTAEQAQPEACNSIDDDCDGDTDESC